MTAVPKSSPALREPKTLRQKSCRHCGTEFRPRTSLAAYCSMACNRAGQSAKWAAKRGNCERCDSPLAHRKKKRFCSTACWYAANTKPIQLALGLPKRSRPSRICQGCGERFVAAPSTFGRGRRFCSLDCYNRHEPSRQAQYDEANCADCGIPFTRRPANMRQHKGLKFCSSACSKSYFRGARSPAWRGGSNPNRGAGWLKRAEAARERDGHRCRRCGKSQEDNGERLSVDHLIPWRTFDSGEEANQLDNLVSLCRICHAIKTQGPERAWLKGDVLAMQRHIEAVTLPSTARASGFLA